MSKGQLPPPTTRAGESVHDSAGVGDFRVMHGSQSRYPAGMRASFVLLFALPLSLAGATARADALPDPDPYEACKDMELGTACFSSMGDGYCVDAECPGNPGQKCGYCDPDATATTSAGSSSTGAGTTADTSGSSGTGASSSGSGDTGGTSDGTSPKKEEGCGCRSDASPAGALGLLGLVGLLRRRRR